MKLSLPLFLLGAFAAQAQAGIVTGHVVDSNGVGLANVDLDFDNLGSGGDPTVSQDFTDANGFFSVVVPSNPYDVYFKPPAPPLTDELVKVIPLTIGAATINLGEIVLLDGVVLSGKLINPAGVGVAGVNLDVLDANGVNLTLVGDTSNVTGNFSIAVPAGALELLFNTQPVLGQLLASTSMQLVLSGDSNLGNLPLLQGYTVTGLVKNSLNQAVAAVDVDAIELTTGDKLYTPNDNSGPTGLFSVVVPAGTYDFTFCPPFAKHLVAGKVAAQTVAAPKSLGTVVLTNGVVLSGTISTWDGQPAGGADVDLEVAATALDLPLCADNANGAGFYQVIVPTGTFNLTHEPVGYSQELGAKVFNNLVIAGNLVQNGVLPLCDFGTNYGQGSLGTGGFAPHLASSGGAPRVGNLDYRLELSQSVGASTGLLGLGFGPSALPFLGGTLLIDLGQPVLSYPVVLGGAPGLAGAGTKTFALPVPISASMAGIAIYCQYGVFDSGAAFGFALSDAYSLTFCL